LQKTDTTTACQCRDPAVAGGVRLSCVATKFTGEVRLDCDQTANAVLKLEDIKEEGKLRNTDQNRKLVMYVTSDRVRLPHFNGTAIEPDQPDT